MFKQTQLNNSIRRKRREECSSNKEKQLQQEKNDNSWLKTLMTSLTIMQEIHPTDKESSEESNDEQEEQSNHTNDSNQHQLIQENRRQQYQSRTGYLSVDKWKLSRRLIPNYNKFPSHLFKHLVSKAIPRYRHQINKYLTNPKLLSFIQQYAHLMCKVFELEMEKDYWKYAINELLSTMNWLLRMPKDLTRRYSINWDYPRTEHNIRHRQRLTENKLDQATRELQLHLEQYPSYWSISNQMLIQHTMNIISQALVIVIKHGLQKLHTNYANKKLLMQFDVYDVNLLISFYELNPTEEQKLHMQKIWRAKHKYCHRTIRQLKTNPLNEKEKITTQYHTLSLFNENNRLYIDYDDHQQDQQSFLTSFNSQMRTIIEKRQTNMEQRAQQILAFKNTSSTE